MKKRTTKPAKGTGFTDAEIDAFADRTRQVLAALNIEHQLMGDFIVLLPDGSLRSCWSCNQGNSREGNFLGPKVKDYPEDAFDSKAPEARSEVSK